MDQGEKPDYNAKPEGLCPDGEKVYAIILAILKAAGATETGGCRTFYSPAEWRARGERYADEGSILVVVYDGSKVAPYFSLDASYPHYREHVIMADALKALGLFAEEGTTWFSTIYKKPTRTSTPQP